MHKFLSIILISFTLTLAATFPYSGEIKDAAGAPIKGARVLLLQTKEETITDSLGHFGDYQSALSGVSYTKSLVKPVLDKSKLYFSANEVGERVAVSLFNLQGRLVVSKQFTSEKKGVNSVSLINKSSLASGLYLISLKVGNKSYNFKTLISENLSRDLPEFNFTKNETPVAVTAVANPTRATDTLYINANGYNDTLIVPISENAGSITLTSTGSDPDINFADIALVYDSTNFPKMRGDTVLLNISLKNGGGANVLSVKCSLSTADADVEILDAVAGYNNIEVGKTIAGFTSYKMLISRKLTAGHRILFDFHISDSWGGVWADKISYMPYPFIVSADNIDDDDIPDSDGNSDGKVDVGEIIEYTPQLQNVYGSTITGISGMLMSDSSFAVRASDDLWSFGDMDSGVKKLPSLDYVFTVKNDSMNILGTYYSDMLIYCSVDGKSRRFLLPIEMIGTADTIAPVITISGNNPLTIDSASAYNNPSATALDNKDGLIADGAITKTGAVDVNNLGEYKVVYSATDIAGNIGFDTLKVIVRGVVFSDGMILVPSKDSSFSMGSTTGYSDEEPVHTVSFTSDFWMDTTEVTQGDYDAIMSDGTYGYSGYSKPSWSSTYGVGDNYPAYYVNWYDAVLYANARSKRDGKDTVYSYSSISGTAGNDCTLSGLVIDLTKDGYRLPTESEWEYACRAGTTGDYYGTVGDIGWYSSNSGNKTHTVAGKLKNDFGLYDMSGNVWEWCNDWYGSYSSDAVSDPTGAVTGSGRVLRGGCWIDSESYLRSAFRFSFNPVIEINYIGFRLVCPKSF